MLLGFAFFKYNMFGNITLTGSKIKNENINLCSPRNNIVTMRYYCIAKSWEYERQYFFFSQSVWLNECRYIFFIPIKSCVPIHAHCIIIDSLFYEIFANCRAHGPRDQIGASDRGTWHQIPGACVSLHQGTGCRLAVTTAAKPINVGWTSTALTLPSIKIASSSGTVHETTIRSIHPRMYGVCNCQADVLSGNSRLHGCDRQKSRRYKDTDVGTGCECDVTALL